MRSNCIIFRYLSIPLLCLYYNFFCRSVCVNSAFRNGRILLMETATQHCRRLIMIFFMFMQYF